MPITPTICPDCLRENRVATVNGPTCTHQLNSGALWWPTNWDTMGEAQGVAWLAGRQFKA